MNRSLLVFILLLQFAVNRSYSQTLSHKELQQRIIEKEWSRQYALPPGFPTSKLNGSGNNAVYITGPEQDCNGAIPVCSNPFHQGTSYSGTGSTQEVPSNSCLGSAEKNSVWYIFTVTSSGNLAFEITPDNGSEDYDFALYDITNRSCADIPSGAATEIRCNFSATGGNTGLSSSGSNASEPASGPNQSTLLPVTVGQTYVLVVSNYSSSQNGYTLDFASAGMTASIYDNVPPAMQSATAPCGSSVVTLQLSEAVKCNTIAADGSDFTISGPGGPFTISSTTGINCGTSTSQIQLSVSPTLVLGNTYTLTINSGSDGNTLIDNCLNPAVAGNSIAFTISNPAASISGDNNICKGSSTALTASNGSSYLWSPGGATTQTITVSPTSNTTYNCQVTNGTCGTSTASVTVTVTDAPIPDFTIPAPICAGTSVTFPNTSYMPSTCGGLGTTPCSSPCFFGTISCDPTTFDLPTLVTWSFGDGGISANPSAGTGVHTFSSAGTYAVSLYIYLPFTGCSNIITQDVTVLPGASTLSASGATTICAGQSASLTASGGTSYTWTTGATNLGNAATISVSPSSTTTYTVQSPGCGGTQTQNVTVTVGGGVTVSVNPAASTVCSGTATALTASGATNYTWSPATFLNTTSGASVTSTPTSDINYTVIGSNAAGCKDTAYASITVGTSLTLTATPVTDTICPGTSTTLTASGATNYTWSPATGLNTTSAGTVTANPSTTTNYTIDGNTGSCNGSIVVPVVVDNSLNVNATSINASVCPGDTVSLFANGAPNFSWTPSGTLNTTNGSHVVATPVSNINYTVTGYNSNCSQTDVISISTFIPPTVNVNPVTSVICSGASVNITASGATNYTWSPSADLNVTSGDSVVSTPTTGITYTVVGTDLNGCKDTATASITVNSYPTLSVTPVTDTICPGASATLTISGATSYSWSPAGSLNSTTGNSVIASPSVNTLYTISGTSNNCTDTIYVSLAIDNSLNVSASSYTPSVCPGDTVSLLGTGAPNFSWSPSSSLNISNGYHVVAMPVSTTNYTVTGYNSNCSQTDVISISTYTLPAVSATPSTSAVCEGVDVNMSASGAFTYSWIPSTDLNMDTGSSVLSSPVTGITYSVIGTDANGCKDTATADITVISLPDVTVTPLIDTICPGGSKTFIANGANSYTWFPSADLNTNTGATVISTPATNQMYTVIGTTLSCNDTNYAAVIIDNSLNLSVTPASTAICSGSSATLTASGTPDYSWTPATGLDNSSTNTVTASPTTNTVYTVTGYNARCSETDTVSVTVNPLPTVSINPASATICEGTTLALTATGGIVYSWSPLNGLSDSSTATVNASPPTSVTYTVLGTDINGCSDTALSTITVIPAIGHIVFDPDSSIICQGDSVQLTVPTQTGISYSWSPLSGLNTSSNPSITAGPASTTQFTLISTNGTCYDTTSVKIIVSPPVNVNLTISNDSICEGTSVALTANPSNLTSYTWLSSAGAVSAGGSTYNDTPSAGSIRYYVIATDGICIGVDSTDLYVNPSITIDFPVSSAIICSGDSVQLQVNAVAGISYSWSPSSNVYTADNVDYSLHPTATTNYVLTAYDNLCSDTANLRVIVSGPVNVVASTATPNVCEGQNATLIATGAVYYLWSPASGLSDTSGTTVFHDGTAGTYNYTVFGTDSFAVCLSSDTVGLTVNTLPLVDAGNGTGICEGTSVTIINSGTSAGTCSWSPVPTLSSPDACDITTSPAASTVYTLTVTDVNSCVNSDTLNITVYLKPQIQFSASNACEGQSSYFNNTTPSSPVINQWNWILGDGETDSSQNPNHTYLFCGTYPVALIAVSENGCSDTLSKQTTVFCNPTALILVSDSIVCTNESITFTSGSAAGSIDNWNLGDGNTSSGNSVSYAYSSGNTWQSQLITVNSDGCPDTAYQTIYIDPSPIADFNVSTNCLNDTTSFTDSSTPPAGTTISQWFWDFDADGLTESNIQNPDYIYSAAQSWNASLTVISSSGCSDDTTISVTVNPIPVPSFSSNLVCEGTATTFTNASLGSPIQSAWDFDSNGIPDDTLMNPSYTFPSAGTYTTELVVTNTFGCFMGTTNTVIVYPNPTSLFTSDITSGCEPTCINFSANDTIAGPFTIVKHSWDFGDNSTDTLSSSPAHCYTKSGNYTIKLITVSNTACVDTLVSTNYIEINPKPTAAFDYSPDKDITDISYVNFYSIGSGSIDQVAWDFGDSTYTSDNFNFSPVHQYADTGTYCVTLITTTDKLCKDTVLNCLHVDAEFVLYIPNSFSPNNDHTNEFFGPVGRGFELSEGYEFKIYDRWGNMIFVSNKHSIGWNGIHKNGQTIMGQDTYVYTLKVTDLKNIEHEYKGVFNLIK